MRSVASEETRRERLIAAGRWLVKQRSLARFDTAAEFARALGTSAANVSNYETGKAEVGDELAEKMAEVLGLPILDVRRGLRLWVPPAGAPVQPQSLRGLPTATIQAMLAELPRKQQDELMAGLLALRIRNAG